ncbi:hypothetical protein SAT01_20560 [Sinomonas atrocyanea]|nr:hypothetical protein SAT01_20560 [Sinomonas atrocyanea]
MLCHEENKILVFPWHRGNELDIVQRRATLPSQCSTHEPNLALGLRIKWDPAPCRPEALWKPGGGEAFGVHADSAGFQ